ncbi:hypothetical protein GQ457_10G017400 [Hibiscus cannabinus]
MSCFLVGINFTQFTKQVLKINDDQGNLTQGHEGSKGFPNSSNRYKGRSRPQCVSSQQSRGFSKPQVNTCTCCSNSNKMVYNPYVNSYPPAEDVGCSKDDNAQDSTSLFHTTFVAENEYKMWYKLFGHPTADVV